MGRRVAIAARRGPERSRGVWGRLGPLGIISGVSPVDEVFEYWRACEERSRRESEAIQKRKEAVAEIIVLSQSIGADDPKLWEPCQRIIIHANSFIQTGSDEALTTMKLELASVVGAWKANGEAPPPPDGGNSDDMAPWLQDEKLMQFAGEFNEDRKLKIANYTTKHPKRTEIYHRVQSRKRDNPKQAAIVERLANYLWSKSQVSIWEESSNQ